MTIKKSLTKIPSENQECRKLIKWASYHPVIQDSLIKIRNEAKLTPGQGYHAKLTGIKPGVSDYFLALPRQGKCGYWLEMKRIKNSKTSPEQQSFLEHMRSIGYAADVCYGADEAILKIEQYIKNDPFELHDIPPEFEEVFRENLKIIRSLRESP